MKFTYKTTQTACFLGYIVQAIVNNFLPLLFVTLQSSYDIPLSKITMLVTVNFAIQLVVDLLSTVFVDRIGYRASAVIANALSAAGLILLPILPEATADPFTGILLAVGVYAVGGGLLEVLISPITESCPTDNKEKAMSLLHSFYCWGHVGVVLISTLFFALFGVGNWRILSITWALIPIATCLLFLKTPILQPDSENESGMPLKQLLKSGRFWVFMLMMLCAGAAEQSVSQWASTFAEKGLNIGKTAGDLAGPMTFAILMGTSRAFYGKYGDRINLDRFMAGSGLLCAASYLLIALVPSPVVSLLGCAITGLSVGIMWPGTFSRASASLKGGTAMFALLALAGDLGCSGGPTLVGFVSNAFNDNLKVGILAAIVFPITLVLCVMRGDCEKKVK